VLSRRSSFSSSWRQRAPPGIEGFKDCSGAPAHASIARRAFPIHSRQVGVSRVIPDIGHRRVANMLRLHE
jgi:hypothetical protein